jgi:DNA-binding HxlR family transcriptional regulator
MIVDGKEYRYRIGLTEFHCPVDVTMSYIGGKWKSVVLYYLIKRPLRFGELKIRIPQITDKMLSIQLKALVRDGLLLREVLPETPPGVLYSLSPDGKSLTKLLLEMERWGEHIAVMRGELIEKKNP